MSFWTEGPKGLPLKAVARSERPEGPRPARALRLCPPGRAGPAGTGSRAQGWFRAPGTCPAPSHRCYASSLPTEPSQPSEPSACWPLPCGQSGLLEDVSLSHGDCPGWQLTSTGGILVMSHAAAGTGAHVALRALLRPRPGPSGHSPLPLAVPSRRPQQAPCPGLRPASPLLSVPTLSWGHGLLDQATHERKDLAGTLDHRGLLTFIH